jgi:hypothetical protein
MLLTALLLTASVFSAPDPVEGTRNQPCVVYGEIVSSVSDMTAQLSSNCPIQIEQKGRGIIMTSPRWVVAALIPEEPGVHEFVYQWGQMTARFGDQELTIAFGPAGGA